jgi:hypothetical protein
MYTRPAPVHPIIETDSKKEATNEIMSQISFDDNKESQEFVSDPSKPNRDRLSLFGLSINIDDIIIVGIVIFLFMENKRDYLLLIILGLLLFDISLDTFKNMDIFKRLFNPT